MPARDLDLATLLAPVRGDDFFRDCWEKGPLHIARGEPGYYAGLLSRADVDQVIAFTRPKFVDPDAFLAGPPRARTFVKGWQVDAQVQAGATFPDTAALRRVFAQGKTLILMGMQQRWAPVARLCRRLEGVFHCPVHANMYLTPEGAQGFDAHYDPHEVLVLQLEGSKQWRLYGAPRPLPLLDEKYQGPKQELGPPREIRLEPGDLLYIPRGFVHEAFTADCASMHLTVGINLHRWSDLLHEAVEDLARRDQRFRESVPPGLLGGTELPGAVKQHARELLDELARQGRVDDAARRLGDQFFGQLPPIPDDDAPVSLAADREMDAGTVLEKRAGTICRVIQEGGWVVIEFPGGQIGGPAKIAPALRFVAGAERFPVRALPDALGSEGKLVLARRLVREGLLRVAGQAESGTNLPPETSP